MVESIKQEDIANTLNPIYWCVKHAEAILEEHPGQIIMKRNMFIGVPIE